MTGYATKEELAQIRSTLNSGFADVRLEMGQMRLEMVQIKGELEVKIADVKSDVIRRMFAFFVTMLLAILGLYFKK
jgi:hypothetical protein